jgi:hypothetical protein
MGRDRSRGPLTAVPTSFPVEAGRPHIAKSAEREGAND